MSVEGTGSFDIVCENGVSRVRHLPTGERMHPCIAPFVEAQTLYVEPVPWDILPRPVTVWDVGLGAASNPMALVSAVEQGTVQGQIVIESFEKDLLPLQLAQETPHAFPYAKHPALAHLLASDRYHDVTHSLRWNLYRGDFRETVSRAASPDVVWFDPFSRKVEPEMWTWETLQLLTLSIGNRPSILLTYLSATAVRAMFLALGWYVAQGKGVGHKPDSTICYTPAWIESGYPISALLGEQWLAKWDRSSTPLPDVSEDIRQHIVKQVLAAPQFSATVGVSYGRVVQEEG